MKPNDQQQCVDSMSDVAEAVQAGADVMATLSLIQPWLVNRSKMLYSHHKDLFSGMTWEDVQGEVQERVLEKLLKIGPGHELSASGIERRLDALIWNSLRETKTAAVRRKKRVSSVDMASIADPAFADPCEVEYYGSFEKVMSEVFLLTCVEGLQAEKQRELASQLLRGSTQAQFSEQFQMSKQSTSNLFKRMQQNLKSCIESKRQAFEWTPNSQSS